MDQRFPRSLIRRIETTDVPVHALAAIRDMRRYLDSMEHAHVLRARELGASSTDIAEALGITRQAVYNKLRAYSQATEETVTLPELETDRPERDN